MPFATTGTALPNGPKMGTPSTTQSKPQDPFAGYPPRPISGQWPTERDKMAVRSADIIRLLVDDHRGRSGSWANDVKQRLPTPFSRLVGFLDKVICPRLHRTGFRSRDPFSLSLDQRTRRVGTAHQSLWSDAVLDIWWAVPTLPGCAAKTRAGLRVRLCALQEGPRPLEWAMRGSGTSTSRPPIAASATRTHRGSARSAPVVGASRAWYPLRVLRRGGGNLGQKVFRHPTSLGAIPATRPTAPGGRPGFSLPFRSLPGPQ